MDDDVREPRPTTSARAPLARVTLAKRSMLPRFAPPVHVVEVRARDAEPLPRLRVAVAGRSVWVLPRELAVEELPLFDFE